MGFSVWFNENKNSEQLAESYMDCCSELEGSGEKPPTFKQWCKKYFEDNPELAEVSE